jgi:hypothetical protein
MRHTSAIVAVPSQADTRLSSIGVTWSTNVLGGMFLALWIARLPLSHRPTLLRSPLDGSERPCGRALRAAGCVARHWNPKSSSGSKLRPRRATPFPPNLAFPNPNLDSRLLVEQSQPVVRRFVLQAVHSKTRLDTTQKLKELGSCIKQCYTYSENDANRRLPNSFSSKVEKLTFQKLTLIRQYSTGHLLDQRIHLSSSSQFATRNSQTKFACVLS